MTLIKLALHDPQCAECCVCKLFIESGINGHHDCQTFQSTSDPGWPDLQVAETACCIVDSDQTGSPRPPLCRVLCVQTTQRNVQPVRNGPPDSETFQSTSDSGRTGIQVPKTSRTNVDPDQTGPPRPPMCRVLCVQTVYRIGHKRSSRLSNLPEY